MYKNQKDVRINEHNAKDHHLFQYYLREKEIFFKKYIIIYILYIYIDI